jgi:nitroimidazol reductase NimA-like FMN-containing flavoprotein (pyridoxamine 5'-phosphate oxidase superfamily)
VPALARVRLSVRAPNLAFVPLSAAERDQFLAEPHVAALSVSAGPDRAPLVVPIWYQYRPGEDLWILTPADSLKARLIQAAGRFSMMVDRLRPTVRYVSVEGPVSGSVPMTDAALTEIAARYLSTEMVQPYVEMSKTTHGPQLVISMRPERWLSSDLGAF